MSLQLSVILDQMLVGAFEIGYHKPRRLQKLVSDLFRLLDLLLEGLIKKLQLHLGLYYSKITATRLLN